MSVVIIGVHKSNCIGCICTDDDARYCWAAKRYIPMDEKPEFCPMVELPDHGDLIDRDALCIKGGRNCGKMFFAELLKNAPVVIPAERREDWEEPEINPCRGCDDYDGVGGCKSHGGCGAERSEDAQKAD